MRWYLQLTKLALLTSILPMTLKKKVICINRPEDFKIVYYRMAVQQNFVTMEAFYISA